MNMRFSLYQTILLLCSVITLPWCLSAQDTLILRPERAEVSDLVGRQHLEKYARAETPSGELTDLNEMPFTTYVITSEEILRQNISTLTDVFRALPGTFISPSGSGTDGEKFMINGLDGNRHMKILINQVPVKPWAAGSMPIGSQLPIRQAQRIEIMYGGGASFYGDETCAGVIHIILAESERPVFTRTNLGFGRFGYNDLDLTFGGKLGKDKNILRFTLYGRSTIQSDRDIFYDASSLYNYKNYLLFPEQAELVTRNPDFFLNSSTDSAIAVSSAPLESRLFGILFQWRGIRFRYDLMNRRDFSSVGLNPWAIAYRNPGDRNGEKIETFSLDLDRTRKRRQSSLLLSTLLYKNSQNARKSHVFPAMGQSFLHDFVVGSGAPQDSTALKISDRFYSGQRFVANQGIDFRLNYRMSFTLAKGLTYGIGLLNNVSVAQIYSDLYNKPIDSDALLLNTDTALVKPFDVNVAAIYQGILYNQMIWKYKRIYALAGVSGHYMLDQERLLRKRLAVRYRIWRTLDLNAVYSEGYTPISPYFLGNSVTFTKDRQTVYYNELLYGQKVYYHERTNNWELSARYHTRRMMLRATVLGMHQTHSLEGGYRAEGDEDMVYGVPYYFYGFWNDGGAKTKLSAVRLEAKLDSSLFHLVLNKKQWDFQLVQSTNIQISRGSRTGVADAQGQRVNLDYIPNYPGWIFRYQLTLINKNFDLNLMVNMQSGAYTNLGLYQQRYPALIDRTDEKSTVRTIDLMSRVFLNKNFSGWIDIRNLMNRRYAGIDATGTPDDLLFNPQGGRAIRFGLQYNLD